MNQQAKNILLEKFIDGTISVEDRRLLEMEALNDDFLFEAMEGFSYADSTEVKLDNLRTKIQNKVVAPIDEKKTKVRKMWIPGIAIAASFLLIASLFWWNSADDSIGESRDYASADVLSDEAEGTDEIIDMSAPVKEPPILRKSVVIDEPNTVEIVSEEVVEEEIVKEVINDYLKSKPTTSGEVVQREKPKSPVVGNSKVEEEDLEPLPVGDLNWEDSADVVMDSDREAVVVIANDAGAEVENSSDEMSSAPTAESVVPPSAAKASKKRSEVDVMSRNKEESKIRYQFAPKDGWKEFDAYILKNKQKDASAVQANINGRVIVEFTINEKGYPTNIKIIESDWNGFNSDAIDLIKLGGKWNTNDLSKPIRYEINY